MSLLEAALPRRQIGLIAFNDRLCRSGAELRSVMLKARAMALENAEHERAAPAFKHWLLAELERDRALRRSCQGRGFPRRCICLRNGLQLRAIRSRRQPSRQRLRPVALPGQTLKGSQQYR